MVNYSVHIFPFNASLKCPYFVLMQDVSHTRTSSRETSVAETIACVTACEMTHLLRCRLTLKVSCDTVVQLDKEICRIKYSRYNQTAVDCGPHVLTKGTFD